MAKQYFTKTQLSNGVVLYVKDEEARQMIEQGIQINFPSGGVLPTASANTMGKFYFIPATSAQGQDSWDEYVTVRSGVEGSYTYAWEKLGNARINLTLYSLKTHTHTVASTKRYLHKTNVVASLSSGSVRGVKSTKTKASKATAGTAKSIATVDSPVVYGKANVGQGVDVLNDVHVEGETLVFGTQNITPAVAAPSNQVIIPAKDNGSVIPYSFEDVDVPIADDSDTAVVTGAGTTADVYNAVNDTASGGDAVVTNVVPGTSQASE